MRPVPRKLPESLAHLPCKRQILTNLRLLPLQRNSAIATQRKSPDTKFAKLSLRLGGWQGRSEEMLARGKGLTKCFHFRPRTARPTQSFLINGRQGWGAIPIAAPGLQVNQTKKG